MKISFPSHAIRVKNVSRRIPIQDRSTIQGLIGIADDIVVAGKSEEEHYRRLHEVMGRCRSIGLKSNPEKCKIIEQKIKLYGVVCGQDAIQPDPSNVSALKGMASPNNVKDLQAFLGLATYMSAFIPSLSSLTTSLRDLLKETSELQWFPEHQEEFKRIGKQISEKVTLSYFNPDKKVVLQVDASVKGLGAWLLQDNKPVAFESKALTSVEARYANIDRELLAVGYGCERFRIHTFMAVVS